MSSFCRPVCTYLISSAVAHHFRLKQIRGRARKQVHQLGLEQFIPLLPCFANWSTVYLELMPRMSIQEVAGLTCNHSLYTRPVQLIDPSWYHRRSCKSSAA